MMQNRHKSMNNEIFGKSKTAQGMVADAAVHQNLINHTHMDTTSLLTAGPVAENQTLDVSNIKEEQQSEILLPKVKVQPSPYNFNSNTRKQNNLLPLKTRTYQQKMLFDSEKPKL